MGEPNKEAFIAAWPRCFLIFMGIIEVLATIILILTEIGNVGANFWTTNVFAGGWGGIVMLAHFIAIFVAGAIRFCFSPLIVRRTCFLRH